METKFCQSCGMPMEGNEAPWGTNADGSKNGDYCSYCYQEGNFTADTTMQEMIEFCVPHMTAGNDGMTEDKARGMMHQFFPTLKRWKSK